MKRRVPRTIPRGAEERQASACTFEYWVDGRRVARVIYHDNGAMEWEQHFDSDGRRHGVEKYGAENGRVTWRARWQHGNQVGWQEQWDDTGRLLVRTRFVRGTGTDLWCPEGRVSEEREFVDGARHGIERWWYTLRTVWRELRYARGVEHGIEREWNAKGRLSRGYPRYHVNGERVSRRAYEKARKLDPLLPARTAKDDRPYRTLSPEMKAALRVPRRTP